MDRKSYHRQLRAIGQALEANGLATFELKPQTQRFLVSGTADVKSSWLATLLCWRGAGKSGERQSFTFLPSDLQRLEKNGRANRRRPHQMPEFYNVSNILRTVGAYLDGKNAGLIELQKRSMTLTLLYHSHSDGGHPRFEDRTIASFYSTFVALHSRRGRTDKQPP